VLNLNLVQLILKLLHIVLLIVLLKTKK
jgi:hypothetical protein